MVTSNYGNLIVCGPNSIRIDMSGRTIGFIKKNFRDILGITRHYMPMVEGSLVNDDFVIDNNSLDLVFSRKTGSRSR